MKHPPSCCPGKQRGTAIIVALFVVALVAAASIAMIDRLRIDTRRTELLLNDVQANLYAQGSIAWAREQLINDEKSQRPNEIVDATPITSAPTEVNGAKIISVIYDAQAKFNLNNLTDNDTQPDFTRLLQTAVPALNTTMANNITLGVTDWIKLDPSKVFDDYYGKLQPPYRAPHRLMVSPSEFRLIKGVTAQLFTQLEPFITALPTKTSINVNNAPIPVLMSLSQNMTLDIAKEIAQHQQQAPFSSTQDFLNLDVVKKASIADNKITVVSDYFLVETHVAIGDQQITINTLLQRVKKNSQPSVIIIWQSKGTL